MKKLYRKKCFFFFYFYIEITSVNLHCCLQTLLWLVVQITRLWLVDSLSSSWWRSFGEDCSCCWCKHGVPVQPLNTVSHPEWARVQLGWGCHPYRKRTTCLRLPGKIRRKRGPKNLRFPRRFANVKALAIHKSSTLRGVRKHCICWNGYCLQHTIVLFVSCYSCKANSE